MLQAWCIRRKSVLRELSLGIIGICSNLKIQAFTVSEELSVREIPGNRAQREQWTFREAVQLAEKSGSGGGNGFSQADLAGKRVHRRRLPCIW